MPLPLACSCPTTASSSSFSYAHAVRLRRPANLRNRCFRTPLSVVPLPAPAGLVSVRCCTNGGSRATAGTCFQRVKELWLQSTSSESDDDRGTAETVSISLRRIWKLISDERSVIFVALGSLTVAAISEITMPRILAASVFAAQSGNLGDFRRNARLLVMLCCISGVCSGLRSGCFALVNTTLVKRLRETLYSTLIFQDMSFFDAEAVGDLTSRLGADCQQMSHIISKDLHLIFRNILQGTGALVNLLSLSWTLTLSTLVVCFVLAATFLVYGRYLRSAAKLSQDFTACANQVAEDTFSQIRTVRAYGTEMVENRRFKQWLEQLACVGILDSTVNGLWHLNFTLLYRSTQIFAVMAGGISVMSGHASLEQLTKYVLYCEWMIYATWRLVDNLSSFMQSIGASERVFKLMSIVPGDQNIPKGLKLQRVIGQVDFINVSFCYPSRIAVPVVRDMNLSIQPREVVAIVGPSGCGKTSLVNMLLRLYQPFHGQIYLDNLPLENLDVRWLRSKIGYVGQEPSLFHMDVKSNISYGCFRDTTEEDIQWASKAAGVHEFISSLPCGYDTLVHEGLLSGGQKQRIAIARAILRDPDLLILDEATSSLDLESEQNIKALIDHLRSDVRPRTIIVIAHRLMTVTRADRIIVMDGGKVVEVGTHSELLHKNGLYAHLFKLQTDWLR